MISVDTNVVVRLLTGDHPEQSARAKNLFASNAILITSTVLLETEWVLRSAYKFAPDAIRYAFNKLLGLQQVSVDEPVRISEALALYALGADFADALHVAGSSSAKGFASFDRELRTRISSTTSQIEVIEP